MKLYKWQIRAITRLRKGVSVLLACAPGAGKTLVIVKWLELTHEPHAIIIAPTLVIYDTWTDHLERSSLKFAHAHGKTFEAACKVFASGEVDILLSTPEMFIKIEDGQRGVLRACRQIIIDESTKYKNASSGRFKSIRRILRRYVKIEQRICMTGTLLPKHYLQLFSQLWIVGRTEVFNTDAFSTYRDQYFYTKPKREYDFILFPGFAELLEKRIAPYIMQPNTDEYRDMPPLIEVRHHVNVGKSIEKLHKQMDKDKVITVNKMDVIAANAGVALFKRAQICSGYVYKYTDPNDPSAGREQLFLHNKKSAILQTIVEEAQSNVIIFYCYRFNIAVIRQLYPNAVELKTKKNIKAWKDGKIEIAYAHPASMGHGLNLQTGGSVIIWFDMTPDAEIWWQAIKRLHRGSITEPVYVHYLLAHFKGSTDEYLLRMVHKKYKAQEELLARLKSLE